MFPTLQDCLNRETGLSSQRKDGLILFDYDRTVTYNSDWDEVTLNCRGIVFEESTGKIIARAYPKFFNHSEPSENLPPKWKVNLNGRFRAMEKADGSMGIVYNYNGNWFVNTRGSFNSEQAIWATNWLNNKIDVSKMNPEWTYLVEIIYPQNKIVIDYGDREELVLHGIIDRNTGEEFWTDVIVNEAIKLGLTHVKIFDFSSFEEIVNLQKVLPVTEEGFVITFENGYKCKIKGDEYCKLHKALSYITPIAFWELIDVNSFKIPTDVLTQYPEEFRESVDMLVNAVENLHVILWATLIFHSNNVPQFEDSAAGNKDRYMFIKANVPSNLIDPVLSIVKGNINKAKMWVHREVRPKGNFILLSEKTPIL